MSTWTIEVSERAQHGKTMVEEPKIFRLDGFRQDRGRPPPMYIGAFILRIGFWDVLYCNYNKELPKQYW